MKKQTTHTISNKVSRLVGLFLVFGVLLGVSSQDVFAQVPPANTQIGNQASATYVDNGGNNQSITSNTVQTIVQQVAGVDISDGITLTGSPGGQVYFPHTVTNTGNGVDSYNLTHVEGSGDFDFDSIVIYADEDQDGVPDNFNPITVTPNIDPAGSPNGNTYGIVIVVNVPLGQGAVDGASETFNVTATSAFDGNEFDVATNTVNVTSDANIQVQKQRDKQFVIAGETVTYTFSYNEASGFANGSNLVIKDPLPEGVSYVPGSGVWSGAAGTPLTDAPAENASGIQYEFKLPATNPQDPDSVIIEIANINAGATGTVSFQVTVDVGQEGNTIVNNGTYSHDDSPTPVLTNNASITVDQIFAITALGADSVIIESAEQGNILNFLNTFRNDGSGTDRFNISLAGSTYPTGTAFLFYKVDANGQPSSTFTDTNNDGIPDTGPVPADSVIQVILQVQLPSGESGSDYGVTKTLTSIGDPNESDFHIDALGEITTPTVDITNLAALGQPGVIGVGEGPEEFAITTETANPGTTVNFGLFINNTSTLDDTYDLAVAIDTTLAGDLDNPGTLPTGWTASFRDPNNGNNTITSVDVDAGTYKEVTFRVNIPAGYQPGNVSLYVRALSQITGAKDIKHEAVVVETVRLMTLVAGQSGTVSPGGTVDYQHTLTINSNVDENVGGSSPESELRVDLSNSVPVGWTALVFLDTNNDGQVTSGVDSLLTSAASSGAVVLPPSVGVLQYGDQLKFIVQVTASTGLDDGASVTTTISVIDNLGSLANVSNDDQTDVQAGRLSIDKWQAPTINEVAGTYTKADFNVFPGDTVWYKITIVNDGSEPVTNVVIQDNVPSYTLIAVEGTFTVDNGSIPGIALDANNPAVGASGIVKITAPQLDPTEQFTLYFAVKVDE